MNKRLLCKNNDVCMLSCIQRERTTRKNKSLSLEKKMEEFPPRKLFSEASFSYQSKESCLFPEVTVDIDEDLILERPSPDSVSIQGGSSGYHDRVNNGLTRKKKDARMSMEKEAAFPIVCMHLARTDRSTDKGIVSRNRNKSLKSTAARTLQDKDSSTDILRSLSNLSLSKGKSAKATMLPKTGSQPSRTNDIQGGLSTFMDSGQVASQRFNTKEVKCRHCQDFRSKRSTTRKKTSVLEETAVDSQRHEVQTGGLAIFMDTEEIQKKEQAETKRKVQEKKKRKPSSFKGTKTVLESKAGEPDTQNPGSGFGGLAVFMNKDVYPSVPQSTKERLQGKMSHKSKPIKPNKKSLKARLKKKRINVNGGSKGIAHKIQSKSMEVQDENSKQNGKRNAGIDEFSPTIKASLKRRDRKKTPATKTSISSRGLTQQLDFRQPFSVLEECAPYKSRAQTKTSEPDMLSLCVEPDGSFETNSNQEKENVCDASAEQASSLCVEVSGSFGEGLLLKSQTVEDEPIVSVTAIRKSDLAEKSKLPNCSIAELNPSEDVALSNTERSGSAKSAKHSRDILRNGISHQRSDKLTADHSQPLRRSCRVREQALPQSNAPLCEKSSLKKKSSKNRITAPPMNEVLGKMVKIEFVVNEQSGETQYYKGTIKKKHATKSLHLIIFEDGDKRWFDLKEQEQFGHLQWLEQPASSESCVSSQPTKQENKLEERGKMKMQKSKPELRKHHSETLPEKNRLRGTSAVKRNTRFSTESGVFSNKKNGTDSVEVSDKVSLTNATRTDVDDTKAKVGTSDDEWSFQQLQKLKYACRKVDPRSANFWDEVSLLVKEKSVSECRQKWFMMVKTPCVKPPKKTKKMARKETLFRNPAEKDDIFNSTPMRCYAGNNNVSSVSIECPQIDLDFGSAIKMDEEVASSFYAIEGNDEPFFDEFRPMVGHKSYLANMKRDVNRTIKNLKRAPAVKTKTSCYISETVNDGDVRISGRLTPGGTLVTQLSGLDEDDFWDEVHEEEDLISDCGQL